MEGWLAGSRKLSWWFGCVHWGSGCDCLIVRVTLSVSSALPYPRDVVYRIVPAAVLSILF